MSELLTESLSGTGASRDAFQADKLVVRKKLKAIIFATEAHGCCRLRNWGERIRGLGALALKVSAVEIRHDCCVEAIEDRRIHLIHVCQLPVATSVEQNATAGRSGARLRRRVNCSSRACA